MFGGTLQIIYPAMNQIGVPPGALEVSGNWTDRGMPEPYVLERITIWLDEDPGIEAQITRIVNPGASVYSGTFKSPAGSLTVADGTHRIVVAAIDDHGTITEDVTFTVGAAPVNSELAGTCTAKGATILTSPETIGLSFLQPSTVTITSFPAITPPAVSVSGLTLTTTITMVSSGTGTFNLADGSISIPDVNLKIDATINGFDGFVNINNSATVTITLTTGPSSSPAFNDAGTPMQASGEVTLVGDGVYSTPIFGLSDFGIALSGTIAPIP
jgi:hypothetical protein